MRARIRKMTNEDFELNCTELDTKETIHDYQTLASQENAITSNQGKRVNFLEENSRKRIRLCMPILHPIMCGTAEYRNLTKILNVSKELLHEIRDCTKVFEKSTRKLVSIEKIEEDSEYLIGAEVVQEMIKDFNIEEEICKEFIRNIYNLKRGKPKHEDKVNSLYENGVITKGSGNFLLLKDYYFNGEPQIVNDNTIADLIEKEKDRIIYLIAIEDRFTEAMDNFFLMDLSRLPGYMTPKIDGRPDQFTKKYEAIIQANSRLDNIIKSPSATLKEKRSCYMRLHRYVWELISKSDKFANNERSIMEKFKGKYGTVRGEGFSKRQDYAGRSVVVVDPTLSITECSLPRHIMAVLYRKYIAEFETLCGNSIDNLRDKCIEGSDEVIALINKYKLCEKIPVSINRAPTLHRLSFMAFMAIMGESGSIGMHPLICSGYNMDFDGDQAGCHINLNFESVYEVLNLMLSARNVFIPANGKCTITPRHEMLYGLNMLTKKEYKEKSYSERTFNNYEDFIEALFNTDIRVDSTVTVNGKKGLAGHLTMRYCVPLDDNDVIVEVNKKTINYYMSKILSVEKEPVSSPSLEIVKKLARSGMIDKSDVFELPLLPNELTSKLLNKEQILPVDIIFITNMIEQNESNKEFVKYIDRITKVSFEIATLYAPTVDLSYKKPDKLFDSFYKSMNELTKYYNLGFEEDEAYQLRYEEEYQKLSKKLSRYIMTDEEIEKEENDVSLLEDSLDKSRMLEEISTAKDKRVPEYDGFAKLVRAGARGDTNNLMQNLISKGRPQRSSTSPFNLIIENSYAEGLSSIENFATAYGTRSGLADRAIKTGDTGYSQRLLGHTCVEAVLTNTDCGTTDGINISKANIARFLRDVKESEKKDKIKDVMIDMITGRYEAVTNIFITRDIAKEIANSRDSIIIRSVITCKDPYCTKCYGVDLTNNGMSTVGLPIGLIADTSISEPATQLTMQSFKAGGVAGVTAITTDYDRLAAYIRMYPLYDKYKNGTYGNYDPIAWQEGRVITEATGTGKKKVYIQNDNKKNVLNKKFIMVDERMVLKDRIEKAREGLCIIEGDHCMHEMLNYCTPINEAQDYLLNMLYFIYYGKVDVNIKHFEVLVASMTVYILKNKPKGRDDLGFGMYYTNKEVAKINDDRVSYTPTIIGIRKGPLTRSTFLSTIAMEYLEEGLGQSVLLKKEDPVEGLFERLMFGLKPRVGTAINENYIEERNREERKYIW